MMDEKMKAAFDAWGVERSKKIATLGVPTPYEYAEWTLDYLRSQQEPVGEMKQDESGDWNISWKRAICYGEKLYTNPIPSTPAVPEKAVTPDNGWKCKTCGRGQDAFHWGCDTEGWDRPARPDNESAQPECCGSPAQCWEPCGELGKSAEHATVAPDEELRSERVRQALSDAGFRLQDDYFLAHGA